MSDKSRPDDTRPGGEDVQESLDRAIDTLEQMLSRRAGAGRSRPEPEETGDPSRGEQYTIPLLNDVVVPGTETAPEEHRWTVLERGPELVTTPDMDIYRKLFERLASEIEIIIQTGVEEALESGREKIRKRISDHIDIVLPEILEEIALLNSPKDP